MPKLAASFAKPASVMLIGDSLFEHRVNTEFSDEGINPTTSPPALTVWNAAYRLWRSIPGEKATYRRFDYPGFFTETGFWRTGSSTSTPAYPGYWSDNFGRQVETRYCQTSAGTVSFTVPPGRFSLIYRTDIVGGVAVITTTDDVELPGGGSANNYHIDMLSPNIYSNNATEFYAHKEFIANEPATLTMANYSAGDLMYWGIEMYQGESPVRLINMARAGHNFDELYSFRDMDIVPKLTETDLFILEAPMLNIINDGWTVSHIQDAVDDWAALLAGKPVVGLIPHYRASYYSGNDLITGSDVYYEAAAAQFTANGIPYVDMRDAVLEYVRANGFDTIEDALLAGDKRGPTLTIDGSHGNDKMAQLWADEILKAIAFVDVPANHFVAV